MNSYRLLFLLFTFIGLNSYAQVSDLSLEIVVDNKTPNVRSEIKFTITLNNSGPDEATGVAIVNELSNGYGNIKTITKDGIIAGNTISWGDIKIPAYSNLFFHFTAKVLSSGEYGNRAEIVASDSEDPNSDPESSYDYDDYEDGIIDDDEVIIDDIEPLPSDFDKDKIFDINDDDDDNDGIPDILESNGIDPDSDFDNDGTPVYLDDNDDNFDIGDNNNAVEAFFDFDGDGIANHLDYDADNDGIFDVFESGLRLFNLSINKGKIFGTYDSFGKNGLLDVVETAHDSGKLASVLLNTDKDDYPNFLDTDDDNDGILTKDEESDPNKDGDPEDAVDKNDNGIADFLDAEATVSNPLDDVIIDEPETEARSAIIISDKGAVDIKLFTERGREITPTVTKVGNLVQLDISKLESGVYFLQFKTASKVDIKRMVID